MRKKKEPDMEGSGNRAFQAEGKAKYKGLAWSKAFHIQRTKRPLSENV